MNAHHGTNDVIGKINLSQCKLRTDFGRGFYFSDKLGTAQTWAVDRAAVRGAGTPTVLLYALDFAKMKASLPGKQFPSEPTEEWFEFIGLNRQKKSKNAPAKEPKHDYHWVSGPIADDKMNDVVEEYLAGEISVEEAMRRAKTLPRTFQLSLHTQEALAYVDDVNVLYRQLKGGRWLPLPPNWAKRKSDSQ